MNHTQLVPRGLAVFGWLSLFILWAPVVAVQAQVPATVAYQGYLTDADGTPLDETGTTLFFRLYDTAAGGSPLWLEKQTDVVITEGVFTVQLGSVEPLGPVPFEQPLDA